MSVWPKVLDAAQQNPCNPISRQPLRRPKLHVVPVGLAARERPTWAVSFRCEDAYKRIDQWCARNGHKQLVACLIDLYQQIRMRTVSLVNRGRGDRIAPRALLLVVKSHHRHRSHAARNRMDLLWRHLRLLVAIGLLDRGRGWVRYVDVSELDDFSWTRPTNGKRVVSVRIAKSTDRIHLKKPRSLKTLGPGRGSKSARQTRVGGRFGAIVELKRTELAKPIPKCGTMPHKSGPPAASPARTPTKTAARGVPALPQPDEVVPDVVLRAIFTRHRALAALAKVRWFGCGRKWRHWQAGIAAMVSQAPGALHCSAAVAARVAGLIAQGRAVDPRTKPGFFAHAGWGRPLLELAGVRPDQAR